MLLNAYLVVLCWTLPEGVNRAFALEFLFICSICTIVGVVMYGLSAGLQRGNAPFGFRPGEQLQPADAILVLLPVSPVVGYVLRNLDTLRWHDALVVVCIFALLSLVIVVVIPRLLNQWLSSSVAALLAVSLAFTLANMASVTRGFRWHRSGDVVVQVAFFSIVFAACFIVHRKDPRSLRTAATFYLAGTVLVAAASKLTADIRRPPPVERPDALSATVLAQGRQLKRTPDIFLMTYDSYVENETMLQYGIDNSAQEAFLEAAGFRIYRGAYSVAAATRTSMGRVLGRTDPALAASGHSALFDVLRNAGYRTHAVFRGSGFFWGKDSGYDDSFPPSRPAFLAISEAILEGQFRHGVSFEETSMDEFHRRRRSVITGEDDEPIFLYAHSGPGHSQNSGKCLDDEVARFTERLDVANAEMRVDIDTLIESRPDAIVIVNGDHGPYLTKNCSQLYSHEYAQNEIDRLDIQDRYGTFLAIRWPPDAQIAANDLAILQDVFPAVLGYLYDDSIFHRLRLSQEIVEEERTNLAGLSVRRGRIVGGRYDGQPLFTRDP